MIVPLLSFVCFLGLQQSVSASTSPNNRKSDSYKLQPFNVDLSHGVPHLMDLVKRTSLPKDADYLDPKAGISLENLTSLRTHLIGNFNWENEQQKLNKFHHYTAEIEDLIVHFIHQKSKRSDAIPLILNHGWPGSFLEFIPLIELLKEDFHVIIPSLPGFAFSSAPPANWTTSDTARVFNSLMTEVLGYSKYATYGTDWGSAVSYDLYSNYNTSVRAGHFSFIPFYPWSSKQLAANNISLLPLEQFEVARFQDWATIGNAYFLELSTQPNSVGFALYDNPIGHLSYLGGKFIDWSDPRAGSSPSVLNRDEILKSTVLYYLTKSIISSSYIYYTNPGGFRTNYTKPETDAPLLFSAFKYNTGYWPPALVGQIGNLVYYGNHEFGGHFPGLDNPTALAKDLKEIKKYWK